jgi:hypothetical protein
VGHHLVVLRVGVLKVVDPDPFDVLALASARLSSHHGPRDLPDCHARLDRIVVADPPRTCTASHPLVRECFCQATTLLRCWVRDGCTVLRVGKWRRKSPENRCAHEEAEFLTVLALVAQIPGVVVCPCADHCGPFVAKTSHVPSHPVCQLKKERKKGIARMSLRSSSTDQQQRDFERRFDMALWARAEMGGGGRKGREQTAGTLTARLSSAYAPTEIGLADAPWRPRRPTS